jgi:alkylation response protein AidB-like acyl-CoA dehydrogenase
LTEEQSELAALVRDLLSKRSGSAAVRRAVDSPLGYDADLWRILCEQVGVAALAIPEGYGGAGYTSFETHLVLEQLGQALAPTPLLGSGVLATGALLLSGDDAACARILPSLAEGSSIGALAWADEDGHWPTGAGTTGVRAVEGEGWTLRGTSTLVLEGDTADVLLVVASTPDGLGLFEVDPAAAGVRRTRTPALDLTLRVATVELDDAPAVPLSFDAAAWLPTLYDLAAVAVTALQVGTAQRGLDLTVAYAKERVQFGRPLGSFQALKHRMADMLVEVETARSASWAAAQAAVSPGPHLAERASVAKAWCSEALSSVASETVQLHGGIAITWEHDAHLVFKRAHAFSQLFGQPHEHRRRVFERISARADRRAGS